MSRVMSLAEAVSSTVKDGDTVAMEGFTHLIPHAAGHEIIRQGKKHLTLLRMTPDLIYDQMIGMGCADKVIFSWGGNPGVGSTHRFREAVEKDWPRPLEIEELSHAALANAYTAGASGLPFAVMRGFFGSDLPSYNKTIRFIDCPYTGERLATVPAVKPDCTVIHAQKADRKGNVLLWGIVGVQKEAVMAAKKAIATVEEIVDDLAAPPNAVVLPHWLLSAVAHEPGGAHPAYAQGYYKRDNAFYKAWDAISRDRQVFLDWMERHVLATANFQEFKRSLEAVR